MTTVMVLVEPLMLLVSVAEMTAVPAAIAVTRPVVALTVAMAVLLEVQVYGAVPPAAVNC